MGCWGGLVGLLVDVVVFVGFLMLQLVFFWFVLWFVRCLKFLGNLVEELMRMLEMIVKYVQEIEVEKCEKVQIFLIVVLFVLNYLYGEIKINYLFYCLVILFYFIINFLSSNGFKKREVCDLLLNFCFLRKLILIYNFY